MLLLFRFHQRLVLYRHSFLDVTNLKTDSLNFFEKYTTLRFFVYSILILLGEFFISVRHVRTT